MSIIRVEVNEKIQKEAAIAVAEIGLTVSDACRILLTYMAHEKKMPFDHLIPNKRTLETLEAAKNGDFIGTYTLDMLFAELNADD